MGSWEFIIELPTMLIPSLLLYLAKPLASVVGVCVCPGAVPPKGQHVSVLHYAQDFN